MLFRIIIAEDENEEEIFLDFYPNLEEIDFPTKEDFIFAAQYAISIVTSEYDLFKMAEEEENFVDAFSKLFLPLMEEYGFSTEKEYCVNIIPFEDVNCILDLFPVE